MLPPAPEQGVLMPSFTKSKAPDVDSINREQLRRVEEMEKAKEEGPEAAALRQQHIDEMLQALEEGGEDAFFGTMKADDGILPPKEKLDPEYDEILYRMPVDKKKGPKYYSDLGMTPDEIKSILPDSSEEETPHLEYDAPQEGTITQEEGTIRPGKKASAIDKLLSKCAFYYKLATK